MARLKKSKIKQNNSKPRKKKAILIGVEFPSNGSAPIELSMDELKKLSQTAHYNHIEIISQKRTTINPKPFIGKGKVQEIKQVVGHYSADIVISSKDPDESEVIVPATLGVTGIPDISVEPSALDFGESFVGGTYTQYLTISNTGPDNW